MKTRHQCHPAPAWCEGRRAMRGLKRFSLILAAAFVFGSAGFGQDPERRPVPRTSRLPASPGIKAPKGPEAGPRPRRDAADQPFRRAPMAASSRTVTIPLSEDLFVAFDMHLLRTHTAWRGEGLGLFGPPYHGAKSPFLATADGSALWTTPPFYPWSIDRVPTNDVRELPEKARWRGIKTKQRQVRLLYDAGFAGGQSVPVEESFRVERIGNHAVVVRRFELGPSAQDIWYLAHAEMGGGTAASPNTRAVVLPRGNENGFLAACLLGQGPGEWRTLTTNAAYHVELNAEKNGDSVIETARVTGKQTRAYLRIPAHKEVVAVEIGAAVCETEKEAEHLALALGAMKVSPPAIGPEEGKVREGSQGGGTGAEAVPIFGPDLGALKPVRGDEFYAIEAFPVPSEIDFLVGGMDWLGNGDLAVCTWPGEVYIVEGAQGPVEKARYRRFARGLNEPLGLRARGQELWVLQKCELTRLHDTDGNGAADFYESIENGWGYSGNYHAYAFGPVFDSRGDIFLFFCGQRAPWESAYGGWAVKLPFGGGKMEPFCHGLRVPNGAGMHAGELFATDNQGNWIGACKLNHLQAGAFYGFPSAWPAPKEQRGRTRPFKPPAIWFPRVLAPSASDFVTIPDDRFGPFQGQMLVGDFQNGIVTRVMLEKVAGEWQGAVWPFAKGFLGAVNRLLMGPDGHLYAGGCKRAWSTPAPQEYSLERVRFTGRTPFAIREARARPRGFELWFTAKANAEDAEDSENYFVSQYTYQHREEYGSPEFDHDGKENSATVLEVTRVEVSEDGMRVMLEIEGLRAGYVTRVQIGDLSSASGDPLWHDTFYYTLNAIPEN